MKIKKHLLTFLSGMGILMMIIALYAFKTNPNADVVYVPQTPWENLKVLPQDISKDSLVGLMKNYSASLGVKCNFCHMPDKKDSSKLDFSLDGKSEKNTARGMIKMTNEINENYFKPYFPDPKPKQVHVVNCVLCHRGTAEPTEFLANMGLMYKLNKPKTEEKKE